ncbi:MAG TPA: hypothetical protein VFR02_06130, partial [bacterium]|nr:hypothetical protein [bacterium]
LAVGSADLSIGRLWPSGLVFAAPFLTAALVGAAGVLFRKPRPWLLGSVYLGWVWVETSAAGFTPASYQAWLPPLVLGAAWGAWEWGAGKRPWAAVLPAVLLILCALGEEDPYYRLWASQWSGLKSGVDAAGTYALARDLKDMLGPGETFFEWGDETQLYYLTRQTPPSGILECTPAITGPLAGRLGDRLAADLKRAKPDLFLVNRAETREVGPSDPVAELLRREYRPLGAKPAPGDILFFVRVGSPLDRRYGGTRP